MIDRGWFFAGATFSDDEQYRYRLWRMWEVQSVPMVFVMLNPSTADEQRLDPTLRRCEGFARREGRGGLMVVNLFGLRATDPRALERHTDPVGPENDEIIRDVLSAADPWVVAWGSHPIVRRFDRVGRLLELSPGARLPLCLGINRDGQPRHPLYVPRDCPLMKWVP